MASAVHNQVSETVSNAMKAFEKSVATRINLVRAQAISEAENIANERAGQLSKETENKLQRSMTAKFEELHAESLLQSSAKKKTLQKHVICVEQSANKCTRQERGSC